MIYIVYTKDMITNTSANTLVRVGNSFTKIVILRMFCLEKPAF